MLRKSTVGAFEQVQPDKKLVGICGIDRIVKCSKTGGKL